MALPLPNLDDRNFEQLVSEMIELLPRHSKEWTNMNPSDPGIMILELFAYLVEMDIFQLNRVTNASYVKFLKLVGVDIEWIPGSEVPPSLLGDEQVKAGIILALKKLSYLRAISQNDISQIVEDILLPKDIVSRVHCFPNRYIRKEDILGVADIEKKVVTEMEKEGYLLIIISADNKPFIQRETNPCLEQTVVDRTIQRYTLIDADLDLLRIELDKRRILTTRMYVIQAQLKKITLSIRVTPEKGVDSVILTQKINDNILDFYSPVWGGEDENGFAIGRVFKVSETIEAIENTEGVDYTYSFEAIHAVSLEPINQVFEPEYYEQVWIESISIEVMSSAEG